MRIEKWVIRDFFVSIQVLNKKINCEKGLVYSLFKEKEKGQSSTYKIRDWHEYYSNTYWIEERVDNFTHSKQEHYLGWFTYEPTEIWRTKFLSTNPRKEVQNPIEILSDYKTSIDAKRKLSVLFVDRMKLDDFYAGFWLINLILALTCNGLGYEQFVRFIARFSFLVIHFKFSTFCQIITTEAIVCSHCYKYSASRLLFASIIIKISI